MRRMVMIHALRGYLRHGRVSAQMVVKHANLVLTAHPCGGTQHGGRHRAPDGQQYGKQDQQPESKVLHEVEVSQVLLGAEGTDKFPSSVAGLRLIPRLPGQNAAHSLPNDRCSPESAHVHRRAIR